LLYHLIDTYPLLSDIGRVELDKFSTSQDCWTPTHTPICNDGITFSTLVVLTDTYKNGDDIASPYEKVLKDSANRVFEGHQMRVKALPINCEFTISQQNSFLAHSIKNQDTKSYRFVNDFIKIYKLYLTNRLENCKGWCKVLKFQVRPVHPSDLTLEKMVGLGQQLVELVKGNPLDFFSHRFLMIDHDFNINIPRGYDDQVLYHHLAS
jgi:hypothetical protein